MTPLLVLALLQSQPFNPPPVFVKVCGTCHAPEGVVENHNTRKGWTELVDEMILNGAQASPAEKHQIIEYLAKNFPMRRAKPLHFDLQK